MALASSLIRYFLVARHLLVSGSGCRSMYFGLFAFQGDLLSEVACG